jgi:hypothetical protein
MPTKFCRPSFSTAGYVRLDSTIRGRCRIVVNNPAAIVCRWAGQTPTQPALGEATYLRMASNSSAVWEFFCDPYETWILAETGGGNLELQIDY